MKKGRLEQETHKGFKPLLRPPHSAYLTKALGVRLEQSECGVVGASRSIFARCHAESNTGALLFGDESGIVRSNQAVGEPFRLSGLRGEDVNYTRIGAQPQKLVRLFAFYSSDKRCVTLTP